VNVPFPEPTGPPAPRAEVLLGYLDYFRSLVVTKVQGLSDTQLRVSLLPSGWTVSELVKHLTHVELRWLVWGFEGQPVERPWGDTQDGRWYVSEKGTGTTWCVRCRRREPSPQLSCGCTSCPT